MVRNSLNTLQTPLNDIKQVRDNLTSKMALKKTCQKQLKQL